MKQNIPGFVEYNSEQKLNAHRIEQERNALYYRKAKEDQAARNAIEAVEKAKAEKAAKKEAERQRREAEKIAKAEKRAKAKLARADKRAKRHIIFLATIKKRLLSGIVIPLILSAGCLGMGAAILAHDKANDSKKMKTVERETIKAGAGISIIAACAIMLIGIIMVTARRKNLKPKYIYNLMQELKSDTIPYDTVMELQDLGKIGLNILKQYSKIDDAYINKLLNGKFSDDMNYDQAVAIIRGHLETHPQDLERVLSTYDALQLPMNLFDTVEPTEEITQAAEKLHNAQTRAIQQQYDVTRPKFL